MSPITTHVLDTAKGQPAAGIKVKLEKSTATGWLIMAEGTTNEDGRIMQWTADSLETNFSTGTYQMTFDTDSYHHGNGFFPQVCIPFRVNNTEQHYHVPLLLSPFSYSTYRGS